MCPVPDNDDEEMILEKVDRYELGFNYQADVNLEHYVKPALDYMV